MLLSQMDPVVVEVIVPAICAALASFVGVKTGLATLTTKVDALTGELAKVASGDTGIMGVIRTKVDEHGNSIDDLFQRLHTLEVEHARNHGPRLEKIT